MHVLIGIALKSLLITGLTLGLLQLMKARSAAERSWVAHIGLLALVIMAVAPLVLPSWNVEAPALFGQAADIAPAVQAAPAIPAATATTQIVPAAQNIVAKAAPARPSLSPIAAAMALYAVPAAILLFITFLALARLIAEVVGFKGRFVFDAAKPDGTPRKLLDVSKLTALGWSPRIELEAGIRQTYAWYRASLEMQTA